MTFLDSKYPPCSHCGSSFKNPDIAVITFTPNEPSPGQEEQATGVYHFPCFDVVCEERAAVSGDASGSRMSIALLQDPPVLNKLALQVARYSQYLMDAISEPSKKLSKRTERARWPSASKLVDDQDLAAGKAPIL